MKTQRPRAKPLNVHSPGCNPGTESTPIGPTAQRLNESSANHPHASGRMSSRDSRSTASRLWMARATCLRVSPGAMHMAALRAARTRAEANHTDTRGDRPTRIHRIAIVATPRPHTRNTPCSPRLKALNVHSSGCNPEKRSASVRPTAKRLNVPATDNRVAPGRISSHECHSTASRLWGLDITCLRVAPGAMHMAALRATRTRSKVAA